MKKTITCRLTTPGTAHHVNWNAGLIQSGEEMCLIG